MSRPLFSVVTPVFRPPLPLFADCVQSVVNQSCSDWELLLVDDGNDDPDIRAALAEFETSHAAVHVIRSAKNLGIAGASQLGLEAARGEYVALLDHDDLLSPDALERVAAALHAEPDVDYLYTDEDKVDESGLHFEPFFKPDWSPERFRSQMYTCHLSVVRRELALEVGGFRRGFDGSQDYDLILRVTERARRVHHLPEILYHWRAHSGSTALYARQKPAAIGAAKRALAEHCQRSGIDAGISDGIELGTYRVHRRIAAQPLVSLIIPTNGKVAAVRGREEMLVEHFIDSIASRSSYENLEYVVVHDARMAAPALASIRDAAAHPLVTVAYSHDDSTFNFSEAINRGVAASRGEILVIANDDMELITADWIEQFVGLVGEPDVGAVGGKYYFEDDTIQHAGLACAALPYHLFYGRARGAKAFAATLAVTREVSALTGACLAVTRDNFLAVGGFTEQLPINFNDVDFSLKLRSRGLRNIWTPHVELYHFESRTRDSAVRQAEVDLLTHRWGQRLREDPYYNPNLEGIWPAWEPYPDWATVTRGWPRPVHDIFTLEPEAYIDANPDLAAERDADPGWDAVAHFLRHGIRESRLQTSGYRRRPTVPHAPRD